MSKKIAIIGAGIAGLSAGVHGLRNGYEVEIYEKHSLPGGLCTAWQRKGYTFDGCIHWLVGTKKGSQFNRLWQEICDLNQVSVIDHDCFMRVEGDHGKVIEVFSDLDRFKAGLGQLEAEDERLISALLKAAKTMAKAEFPLGKPDELIKAWDIPGILLKTMPMFKLMGQFARLSIAEYLGQIKNAEIRNALALLMPTGYSMISLISTLASLHARDAGFPQGGSFKFAQLVEKRFLEAGGRLNYNSAVEEILVENNRAVGVQLTDGSQVRADLIISAADLDHTVNMLLKGKYLSAKIRDSFSDFPLYSSALFSYGLDADLSAEDYKIALKLEQPLNLGAGDNQYLYLTNYSFDSTLAPQGKSVVNANLYSSYEYWAGAAKNQALYREKKEALAAQVGEIVQKRFPAAKGKIEANDVATPISFNRYTNTYKGAYMSWIIPPDAGRFKISKELPGLDNFYQIGQWVEPPAGLPGSMLTGRQVIQLICHRDRQSFKVG